MKHGDFTSLAQDYARYRPGYADSVLTDLLALAGKPIDQIDAVDVGAGTGIWTAMLAAQGCRSVIAVEPNDEMRATGARVHKDTRIEWRRGSGEDTGLAAQSADFLSMASSFHWVDFERGMREFARVLRPGGRFAALWNPRLVEANPLLAEIEAHLQVLCPGMERKSSGRSGITLHLKDMLQAHPDFDDVTYLESRHGKFQSVEEYLGTWRSVNDIQVQLGAEKFTEFLAHAKHRLSGQAGVETTYLTRAWSARRRRK